MPASDPQSPRGHPAPGEHWWHRKKSSFSSLLGSLQLEDNHQVDTQDLTNTGSSVAVVRCRATVRGVKQESVSPFSAGRFLVIPCTKPVPGQGVLLSWGEYGAFAKRLQ